MENQLDDELRFHLEQETARNIESGMSSSEAHYAALRTFGGFEQSKEQCRDAWGVRVIENIVQDIRYSLRLLTKSPGFSFLAVLTLTLGIGANTAIFSLLDAVVLRSLPVRDPEKLVLLGKAEAGGLTDSFPDESWTLFSYPFFQIVRQRTDIFEDAASLLSMTWNVHGSLGTGGPNAEPQKLEVQLVSGNYFPVLGLNPSAGRLLTEDDNKTIGGHPVVVASYAWAQKHLGGVERTVGQTITIDTTTYTIIGVTSKEFLSTTVGQAPDLWMPLAMSGQLPPAHWEGRDKPLFQCLYIVGRLRTGVEIQQASATVNLLFKQFLQAQVGAQPSAQQLSDIQHAHIELTNAGTGLTGVRRDFAMPLKILMAIVGVVLLISCANVANLLLARAAVRQKEFGVRMALGAGRGRLVRQLLTESFLIAGIGSILGIGLAWWVSRLLLVMASDQATALPLDVSPNIRVLGFTLVVSVLSALVFGLTPALTATKIDLNSGLKDGKGTANATSRSKLAKTFVVAQVGLSLLLMVAAGLFVRTLINLQNIPSGFNQQNVTLFKIDTSLTGLKGPQYLRLVREVEEKVNAVPGVQADSFSFLVFNQGGWSSPVYTLEQTPPKGDATVVRQNMVGPGYFESLGVPLLAGRNFSYQDSEKSQPVAIVSETFAQRFYPGTSAVGKRFGDEERDKSKIEIIGVVRDVKYHKLTEEAKPMVYYVHSQGTMPLENLAVRFNGAPGNVVPQIRQTIRSINSNLPVDEVVTLSEHINRSLVQQKLVSRLALFFGLLALLVSCIGLYGVLSYSVTQRKNEIGVRMALGASTFDVLKLILKDGMKLTLLGVVLGIASAYALTRVVAALLYGVKPVDPVTFSLVALMLTLTALIACYIPARRATKVDPLVTLRSE